MPTSDAERTAALSAIVLAAGAARRMGRPKQTLPLQGRDLLQHVLDAALASRVDEVVLVLGHRAEEIRRRLGPPGDRALRVVVNPDYARGLSSSLLLGLRCADPRSVAAAILLGDQPGVSSALIDRVAAAFLASDAPAARPLYVDPLGARTPGHPVFLSRRLWPRLARLRGDEGARALLSSRPDWLLEVPVEGVPPPDVDRWRDYHDLLGNGRSARAGSVGS